MFCVKMRDGGLNTIFENRIHLVYSFRKCIAFYSLWSLGQKEKGQKDTGTCISITDCIGFSTKI